MTDERQQRAVRAEQMRKEREKAERRQRNIITAGIVVVVVALIALGGFAYNSTKSAREPVTDVITPKGTKDFGFTYSAEDAGGKPASNPVKIVLYEDFQCPVCKAFEQADGAYLNEMVKRGEISIEYRIISFLDRASQNQYSSRAGSAAPCAFESGGVKGYKKVHDLFYANQPEENTAGPESPALYETLKQSGITGDAAESCVLKGKFIPWLEKATDASRKAGVTGTPFVQIEGKHVTGAGGGAPQIADLQKAIDAAKKS